MENNNNPFSQLNQARKGLENKALDKMKNDLLNNYSTGSNLSNLSSRQSPTVDLIGLFDNAKQDKIDLAPNEVDQRDVFKQIGDDMVSKYPVYIPNIDNEAFYAANQSTASKWGNGLKKLGLKTGTAVLGGTVGTITGAVNAIREGSMSALYTDDFNQMLDEYNEKLDYELPNYYTQQERNLGFWDSMGTANFWANDVLGGLSFTLGTIVSEGLWAVATGGTSLIAKGALSLGSVGRWSTKVMGANKALNGLAKMKQPAKNVINKSTLGKFKDVQQATIKGARVPKALNQARFIYTSAGYEAGVEARHYLKEMEDEFIMNFQEQNGRMPNQQELADFYHETSDSGNAVFGANLALVGGSNMAIFGKMLLGKSTKSAVSNSWLKRELFGVGYDVEKGAAKALQATKGQKIAGTAYSVLKAPIIEGVWEEGGQAVASKSVKDYVLSAYDSDATQDNIGMIDSFIRGLSETYGTKEGRKEVGIGMIIGLFGGGVSGGFREISNERKNINNLVDYRNEFQPERVLASQITSERLKANNRIQKANEAQERARANGDLTGEFLSEQQAVLASIERDVALQGRKQGIEDFEAYLNTVNNTELAEEMDMSEEEVQEWKSQKLNEYKELSDRYQENEKYVRALIGDVPLAGAKQMDTSTEQIIKALTYNLTIGHQSKEFTTKIVEDIKLAIAGELGLAEEVMALDVDQALQNSSEKSVKEFKKLSNETRILEEKKSKLENELISNQYNSNVTSPEAHKAKLDNIQKKLVEIDGQLETLEQQKEVAFRALGINNEAITIDDLDSQESRVNALQEKVEGYKETNPELYTTLVKLLSEYKKSKSNTVTFNKMTKELLDPKIRVEVMNGWFSSLLKKNKSFDDSTKEFFKEQLEQYEKNRTQGKVFSGEALNDRTQTEDPEEEEESTPEDNVPVSEKEGDEMEAPVEETKEESPKSVIDYLKGRIKEVMGESPYTTTYIGNDYNEALKNKPSQEDTNRYEELLGKVNSTYISKYQELMNAPKGYFSKNDIETGLTEQELEELKGLQTKLSNWKVLEGSLDGENSSIASMILLIEQLQTEVEKSDTKKDISEKEFGEIKESPTNASKEFESASPVQTPDQVVVKLVEEDNSTNYVFSHIEVTSLTRLFPDAKLEIIRGKVAQELDNVNESTLQTLIKKEGQQFQLTTPEGTVRITVGESARLKINRENFDSLAKNSNIAIVKYGSSNFLDVYERLSNGDLIPLRGDFDYKSTLKNEILDIDPEVVNNLEEGQILITRVNVNDSYNAALIKKYNRSKKTEEDYNELMNNLNIYVTDQQGNIVGSLRAGKSSLKNNTSTKNLLELRRKAIEMVLDENNTDEFFSLNEAIPVRTILVGSPNFVIREQDGTLKPQPIDFTDSALEQVEDVGYMEGETINLRSLKEDEVIKTFLPKNTSEKLPFVVVEVNGKKVAFPVSLKSTTVSKLNEFEEIDQTQLPSAEKISKINQILIDSGLKPSNYVITTQEGGMALDKEKIRQDLAEVQEYPNIVDWVKDSYDISNVKDEAQIAVDLDNKPFHMSKVILDLDKTRSIGQREQLTWKYNNLENREIQLRKNLQDAVGTILSSKMNLYPDVDDVRWTNALFAEGELYKRPENDNERRHNINLMREALYNEQGHRVAPPKAVREAYGDEFFEKLRNELEELDEVIENKKQTRASIKNKKVKDQSNNVNTACKK